MNGYQALGRIGILYKRPLGKIEGYINSSLQLDLRAHRTLFVLCTQIVPVQRVTIGHAYHFENTVNVPSQLGLAWVRAIPDGVIEPTLALLRHVIIRRVIVTARVARVSH